MEDIKEKVLFQGYGLKLFNTSRSRGGIICRTDKGIKELRKTNVDEKMLCFENDVKEHLRNKGFVNINSFIKSVDGKPFFISSGDTYVLNEHVESYEADLSSREYILKAAATLAKIHCASEGFQSEFCCSNIGKVPIVYEKRRNELNRIKKWIENQSCFTQMDLIILKNYRYYNERAKNAIELLKKSRYIEFMEIAKKEKTFCHNAYKNDNIRVLENGEIYVTGFNKCACNYCTIDLAEFIRRYIKNDSVDVKIIYEIIECYNDIRHISKYDIELIYALLSFPYKFFKICNQYYNKRKVCSCDFSVQKIEKCILQSNKEDRILRELKM